MKVKFEDGPAVVLLDEVGEVERGQAVEVNAETGKQLLAQGWVLDGDQPAEAAKSGEPAEPFEGFADASAADVIEKVGSGELTVDDLQALKHAEETDKGRVTVLAAIEKAQGASS